MACVKCIMDGQPQPGSDDNMFTQSLPFVEGLELGNSKVDSCGAVVEHLADRKHPQVVLPSVPANQLQLVANCDGIDSLPSGTDGSSAETSSDVATGDDKRPVKEKRNGKTSVVVTSSGNRGDPVTGVGQELSSLPYMDSSVDTTRSHHQDSVTDTKRRGKHHTSSRRPDRKTSQEEEKKMVGYPLRVTRSTSRKMAAAQITESTSQDQSSVDGQDASHCNSHSQPGQIKYNKPEGFSVTTMTRSKVKTLSADNGVDSNEHQQPSSVNGNDRKNGSHINGDISFGDSSLRDITNSSSNGEPAQPPCAHSSQSSRVYELVAGKKQKKGKRQPSRKPQPLPHKKRLGTSEIENNSTSARQKEMPKMAAAGTVKPLNWMCEMFTKPQCSASNDMRTFKSNECESESNFHTLFQDHSDMFL